MFKFSNHIYFLCQFDEQSRKIAKFFRNFVMKTNAVVRFLWNLLKTLWFYPGNIDLHTMTSYFRLKEIPLSLKTCIFSSWEKLSRNKKVWIAVIRKEKCEPTDRVVEPGRFRFQDSYPALEAIESTSTLKYIKTTKRFTFFFYFT